MVSLPPAIRKMTSQAFFSARTRFEERFDRERRDLRHLSEYKKSKRKKGKNTIEALSAVKVALVSCLGWKRIKGEIEIAAHNGVLVLSSMMDR